MTDRGYDIRGVLGWLLVVLTTVLYAGEPFSAQDVFRTKYCGSAQISPDGRWIAYTVLTQRDAADEPGGSYSELYLLSTQTGEIKPFITGKVNVSAPEWRPDGKQIAFLCDRGEKKLTQVWVIATDGGEAVPLTHADNHVILFHWHPRGDKIAFIAETPKSKREKKLEEKGYGFIYFEENLKHRNLYLELINEAEAKPEQLTKDMTVWDFEFSPDGNTIAMAVSEKNLVDHSYMFKKIQLLDLTSKRIQPISDHAGKLGNFAFSPDGKKLAFAAAKEMKDHAVSQAYVIDLLENKINNFTPANFRGHVEWVGWKDANTLLYQSGEGVWPTLSAVAIRSKERKILLHAKEAGITFSAPTLTADAKHFAFIGSTPENPSDVFYWRGIGAPQRLTHLNPWISDRRLGKQEVRCYTARDGQVIEGLLIYPIDYDAGQRYPLVVLVHGGPESHYTNGWLTRYSEPGQVLAGKGYLVFYPNYRASTGYGTDFALAGYQDPAGVEFDDIADGITFLIGAGLADSTRVGLGGGSYGGYAAAWFSSYYTKMVKAVCMFVGISDLISKRGTTDIPYEELYVHSGKPLEQMWELSLRRSPIYYAHQSRTAVLILGGTSDTRVHPSQSLEFYRILKMNGHPAVRLVQYPGEGHGNRKQPGRIDLLYRILDWYDWYVKDAKPLQGAMPPLDISDRYGLELP